MSDSINSQRNETPAPNAAAADTETGGAAPAGGAEGPQHTSETAPGFEELEERVVELLQTVFDPEIPVDIYELGMVYHIKIDPPGDVTVRMTLTSPSCPVAGSLPGEVQQRVANIEGVHTAKIDLVWDPPWTPEKMSEAAKLQLGFF